MTRSTGGGVLGAQLGGLTVIGVREALAVLFVAFGASGADKDQEVTPFRDRGGM